MKISLTASAATAALVLTMAIPAAQALEVVYACTFPRASTIKQAGADASNYRRIYRFDDKTGEAQLIEDGKPTTKILVLRGLAGISFIEPVKEGTAHITTIANSNQAVHSRHDLHGGTEILSVQYYGTCEQR